MKIPLSISWVRDITDDLKETNCDGGREMPDGLTSMRSMEMASTDLFKKKKFHQVNLKN